MARAREAETRLRVNSRKLSPELRRARGKWKKFGTGVEKDLKKSFGGVRGTIGKLAGFAGVAGFASLGRGVLDFEGKLKRLEIQGGKSKVNLAEFRTQITQVSNATGQSRGDLVDAAARFVSLTGDAAGASRGMELFAKVATATGTTLEDVSATAASLQQNLKIKPEEFEAAFSTLIVQGKAGAIELKDLSRIMSGVAPSFKKFKGEGVVALRELGAAFQGVRRDFGSPEETATGLRGLFTAIQKKARKLKGKGINVLDKKGNLRNFKEIVEEISAKGFTGPQLVKLFGRAEAVRAFQALESLGGEWDELIKTGEDGGAVQRDFLEFQRSAAGKMAAAWERIKNQFLKILTPENIDRLAEAFEGLLGAVKFVIDNMGSLITVFAGFKIFQFTQGIKALGAGLIENGQAIGPLIQRFGALAGAIGLAVAAAGALQLAFDALDRRQEKSIEKKANAGFVKQGANQFGIVRRKAFEGGIGLTKQEKFSARTLSDELRRRDVFEPGTTRVSKKGRGVLRRQAEAETGFTSDIELAVAKKQIDRRVVELIRTAEFAAERAKSSEKERELEGAFPGGAPAQPGVPSNFVEIRIEPGSLIKVEETEKSKRRRRRR